MGGGKTLSACAFSVMDWLEADRKIIANFHIKLDAANRFEHIKDVKEGDFEFLTHERFVYMMEHDEVLYDCTVILDEAYLMVDSRLSQQGYSRLMTYFMLQSRKRDVDLYVTTQQFENIDVRFRRNANVRALCRYNYEAQVCTVRLVDLNSGVRRRVRIYGPEYFPFYDTREIPPLRPFHIDSVRL